ncbi:MAG: SAM-dependent methyltransferase, partial [Gaiellales bacterium]
VTVLEGVNARYLTVDDLPYRPTMVTCDVSFISATLAAPPALACAATGWDALVLVKPQFEAARRDAPKGVVRDPDVHRRAVTGVGQVLAEHACLRTVVASPLRGPKGNREFFLHLAGTPPSLTAEQFRQAVDDAVD